jgi:hypothetical protein
MHVSLHPRRKVSAAAIFKGAVGFGMASIAALHAFSPILGIEDPGVGIQVAVAAAGCGSGALAAFFSMEEKPTPA